MKDKKMYTDEEKLQYWKDQVLKLEMQLKIAKVRIEHLTFKLGKRATAQDEE